MDDHRLTSYGVKLCTQMTYGCALFLTNTCEFKVTWVIKSSNIRIVLQSNEEYTCKAPLNFAGQEFITLTMIYTCNIPKQLYKYILKERDLQE
jgi:hypothetical protein